MSEIVNIYCPVLFHANGNQLTRTLPMFVLTKDSAGQFACYMGLADLPESDAPNYTTVRQRAAEAIHSYGTKLTHDKAVCWFPGLKPEEYRA